MADDPKPEQQPPATPPGVDALYPKEEQLAYPMPDAKKPLKVDGSAIESVILIPKGFKTEYPITMQAEAENASLRKSVADLTSQVSTLKAELETERKAVTEMTTKLQSIEDGQKQKLSEEIVALRVNKGLMKPEDKEEVSKKLSAMTVEQLSVQLEDTNKFTTKPDKPSPEVPAEDAGKAQLSEMEMKKKQLRKEMFGYEEPGGVKKDD